MTDSQQDIIRPRTRAVLDALGTAPRSPMIEWHPVDDDPCSVVVVWSDETASRVSVVPCLAPTPIEVN